MYAIGQGVFKHRLLVSAPRTRKSVNGPVFIHHQYLALLPMTTHQTVMAVAGKRSTAKFVGSPTGRRTPGHLDYGEKS